MLDVGKLATLRAVVAHGSFSAAGQALNLTQPAVSRQVSLLERRVGTQLVRRTQQGVRPTEAGRLLVEHAEAILGRLALAEAEVADVAGLRRGRLRLGSFFTALIYLSAELAVVLEERHPELFTGGAQGIVFAPAFDPDAAPDGVELVPLFDDPPRVLLPAGHRLAGRRSVAPREL